MSIIIIYGTSHNQYYVNFLKRKEEAVYQMQNTNELNINGGIYDYDFLIENINQYNDDLLNDIEMALNNNQNCFSLEQRYLLKQYIDARRKTLAMQHVKQLTMEKQSAISNTHGTVTLILLIGNIVLTAIIGAAVILSHLAK